MNFNDIITPKSIAFSVDEYKRNSNVQPYLGEALFPSVKQDSLDMKFMTGEEDMPTVLKPTAYDAEVPLRDRIGVDLIQGEMPFYREGFLIKEIDRREIQRATSSGDTALVAAAGHIYKDARRLVDGADAAAERMRFQLIAPTDGSPKIVINANGVDMSYPYDPTGKFLASNYIGLSGTKRWTQYATADPVKDIADAVKVMSNRGKRITRIVMSSKTWGDVMKCASVWNYAISTTGANVGALFHSDALAKEVIRANTGITVIVYDKMFKNWAETATAYMPDDIVTFLPDGTLGETRYAVTPEEAAYAGLANAPVQVANVGGVCVSHKHCDIPVKEEIIASQICMPSFEGMYSIYVMKTTANA